MAKFFLILLIPFVFSSSIISIDRSWELGNGSKVELIGSVALNNSYQKLLFVESNADVFFKNEKVFVHYEKKPNGTIWAKAKVLVDYNVKFDVDPPLPESQFPSTKYTEYNDQIKNKAIELADRNSTFSTIKNVLIWVHRFVEYNESYWDKNRTAIDTFQEKQGVCVQYTHLFISIMNSLGFETRYVTGYVFINEWQPHTWAEVKLPNGWFPADPTFAQMGILESNHIAINYGKDQQSTFDSLLTKQPNQEFISKYNFSFEKVFNNKEKRITINYSDYVVSVKIDNPEANFLFGQYNYHSPFNNESTILIIKPNSSLTKYYGINRSVINQTIPVQVIFNEQIFARQIKIENQQCLPISFLLLLALKNAFM